VVLKSGKQGVHALSGGLARTTVCIGIFRKNVNTNWESIVRQAYSAVIATQPRIRDAISDRVKKLK
jgi:hypothetical protein